MSTVLVCGARFDVRIEHIYAVLDGIQQVLKFPQETIFVHGGARGTDRFSGAWARWRGFQESVCAIDTALDDNDKGGAPKRRNIRMKETFQPEWAICFPGGPGTRHMMDICLKDRKMQVLDVEIEGTNFTVWWLRFGLPVMVLTQGILK
jgi:hypothetical protein